MAEPTRTPEDKLPAPAAPEETLPWLEELPPPPPPPLVGRGWRMVELLEVKPGSWPSL